MLSTIYDDFKLPIQYVENTKSIPENLNPDLELTQKNVGSTISVYNSILNPQTCFGNKCMEPFSKYYTTNTGYLKDTQKLCKSIDCLPLEKSIIENTWENYSQIKNDEGFLDKFQYIDWSHFKWLNNLSIFLLILSFYNLASPVINLIAPLFMLVVPFFLLKAMKIPVTMNTYYTILKEQLKKHTVGQLFTQWNSVSITRKMYLIFCFGMYFYNIYQNVLSCKRFYNNSSYITSTFNNLKLYFSYVITNINTYTDLVKSYSSYEPFTNALNQNKQNLIKYYNSISSLPTKVISLKNIAYIGQTMRNFYIIHDSEEFKNTIEFSFGFCGYIDVMKGIANNINTKKMNSVKLLEDKKSKLQFRDFHHPLIKDKPIKNNISLKKNKIITGPNASGKTTLLKSTIINILICQQVGYGFCKSGKITPFHHIHCYMNIPDTNGRDSLFQAEARRCLEILKIMDENKNEKHFAVFDELYSGTNPYEAIGSAHSYLHYISKNKNVKFILTTHFIRLCDLLEKDNKYIQNCNMETIIDANDKPTYKYKMKKGISKIKGGVCVLKQLNYPSHVVDNTKKILNKI